ncbi:MAG: hypothetical protein PUE08_07145 [Eubacteriales bacterium]|nr:hypothetical protein [Eubacteriales bacterium]
MIKRCKFEIVIIFAIFICLIFAIVFRFAAVKEADDFNSLNSVIIETKFSDESIKGQEKACEKDLEKADIILTAVFTGERNSAHYSTLSQMTVTNIIKGDDSLVGKEIGVYENNALGANNSNIYLRNFTPVNFFEKGKEYLLFLDETENYDEMYLKSTGKESKEYALTSYFVSSFCLNETESTILVWNDNGCVIDYNEFKTSEFIVFSREQKSELYSLKEKVLQKYGCKN